MRLRRAGASRERRRPRAHAGSVGRVRAVAFSGAGPAAVALIAWLAPAALAHGPCGCVDPRLVPAGGQVRIASPAGSAAGKGHPAYRVLFNPRPADFGIAPEYLASAHRADVPATTVLDRPRRQPTRRGRFRIPPETPPGLYMVLIFDGGEGGAHNTWDYLHVIDLDEEEHAGAVARSERSSGADGAASDTPGWSLVVGAGVVCLLIGAAGGALARRRQTL